MQRYVRVGPMLVAALAAALAGCGDGSAPAPGGSAGSAGTAGTAGTAGAGGAQALTYYRDVKPIVDARCTSCHVDKGIAPFSLTTPESAVAMKSIIKMRVHDRTMPPWPPSRSCNTFVDDRSLTDAEIATISSWVDSGAPLGDPSQTPAAVTAAGGLSRVDLSLPMPVDWAPQVSPDEYRCFLIDWPLAGTKYVSGFRANPGNQAIVHHVIAFLAPPSTVAEFQAKDDADPMPGYTCFGGPGAGGLPIWLGGWAPGSPGNDSPQKTGIKVQPGSKVVLQVHYNLINVKPGERPTDRTSVDFKLDDSVEREAAILPWADPRWARNKDMTIPAGEADVTQLFQFDPSIAMDRITGGVVPAGADFSIHSAGLHMHTRGTRGTLSLLRQGGAAPECLLQIDKWDFHWQGSYGFSQPKVFHPGDQLQIECHFDNTPQNQPLGPDGNPMPVREVNWGEGTSDEMCLGLFYVTR